VNSKEGADLLTHLVTQEILRKVGQSNGQGDKLLAEEYRSRYVKSHSS